MLKCLTHSCSAPNFAAGKAATVALSVEMELHCPGRGWEKSSLLLCNHHYSHVAVPFQLSGINSLVSIAELQIPGISTPWALLKFV